MLYLIKNECKHHFENIVILCPTLRWNKTYLVRRLIKENDRVFLVELGDKLLEWIKILSALFSSQDTFFIADDLIADEALGKKRQPLLELAVSGRRWRHSLWLLTQSFTVISKNLRRQKKQLFVWYPSEKSKMQLIDKKTCRIASLCRRKPRFHFI